MRNSESYVYEYFEDIKRQVDIRRKDLKVKIDKYTEELIQSIEREQLNYVSLSKEVNEVSTNIDRSKQKLDGFIKKFDTFEINDKKFKDIKNSVFILNKNFKSIISDFRKSLLGHNEYSFKFENTSI